MCYASGVCGFNRSRETSPLTDIHSTPHADGLTEDGLARPTVARAAEPGHSRTLVRGVDWADVAERNVCATQKGGILRPECPCFGSTCLGVNEIGLHGGSYAGGC